MAGLLFSCPEWEVSETVFCYVSFRDEADTFRIIREALARGKKAAVPRVEGKHRMEFYYINSMDDLSPGYMGIPEPSEDAERRAVPVKNDLMVMPGAAFDRSGTRLGYGAGFYDAYLSKHPDCRKLCRLPESDFPFFDAHLHFFSSSFCLPAAPTRIPRRYPLRSFSLWNAGCLLFFVRFSF